MSEFERLVKLIGTYFSPEQWQIGFPWIYISMADGSIYRSHSTHVIDPHLQVEVWLDSPGTGLGLWRLYKVSVELVDTDVQ